MLKRLMINRDLTSPVTRPSPLMLASLLWVVLAVAPLTPGLAAASPPYLAQATSQAQVSSAQAAKAVEERYGGRVLSVDTREREGRRVYRVKILQENGRIRTVNVDAQSGRIMGR